MCGLSHCSMYLRKNKLIWLHCLCEEVAVNLLACVPQIGLFMVWRGQTVPQKYVFSSLFSSFVHWFLLHFLLLADAFVRQWRTHFPPSCNWSKRSTIQIQAAHFTPSHTWQQCHKVCRCMKHKCLGNCFFFFRQRDSERVLERDRETEKLHFSK